MPLRCDVSTTGRLSPDDAVGHGPRQRGGDGTAFFVAWGARRGRGFPPPSQRTGTKIRLAAIPWKSDAASPPSPQGGVLMAAASVPGIHGWDNAYYAWPCGALGLSAFPGGRRGPGVPVRCGRPVAGSAPPLRPRRGPVPLCPPLIPHDCPRPVWHGGRPRLLTRGALTAICCSPRQGRRPLGCVL